MSKQFRLRPTSRESFIGEFLGVRGNDTTDGYHFFLNNAEEFLVQQTGAIYLLWVRQEDGGWKKRQSGRLSAIDEYLGQAR